MERATAINKVFGSQEAYDIVNKAKHNVFEEILSLDNFITHTFVKYSRLGCFEMSVMNLVSNMATHIDDAPCVMNICMGEKSVVLVSDTYSIYDTGFSSDADEKMIRLFNNKSGKVVKMKIGRLVAQCIGEHLPPETVRYASEIVTDAWVAYRKGSEYSLELTHDISKLYDSSLRYDSEIDFGSCMDDKDRDSFYSHMDCIGAMLLDIDGYVAARCIVYNSVYDDDGNKYRLAERQYSSNGDIRLKRILIDKLIREGLIDGYKSEYAAARESTRYILLDDSPLEKTLHTALDYESESTLSYQDTFKYYYPDKKVAYNRSVGGNGCEINLSTTSESVRFEYDSYFNKYCYDSRLLYVYDEEGGRYKSYFVDCDKSHMFKEYDGVLYDKLAHSDIMNSDIPIDRIAECELEYKKKYWTFSDIENDYVKDAVACLSRSTGKVHICSRGYAEAHFERIGDNQ